MEKFICYVHVFQVPPMCRGHFLYQANYPLFRFGALVKVRVEMDTSPHQFREDCTSGLADLYMPSTTPHID